MFVQKKNLKAAPAAMVFIFVRKDGKSILQKIEALTNKYWNASLNIQANLDRYLIYCTKAFGTIDLDDDISPFKPTSDDLAKLTKGNLITYAKVEQPNNNKTSNININL